MAERHAVSELPRLLVAVAMGEDVHVSVIIARTGFLDVLDAGIELHGDQLCQVLHTPVCVRGPLHPGIERVT